VRSGNAGEQERVIEQESERVSKKRNKKRVTEIYFLSGILVFMHWHFQLLLHRLYSKETA
jgi:hypothetical protein